MKVRNITQKPQVDNVKQDASVLITQKETVDGVETEALFRANLPNLGRALHEAGNLVTEVDDALSETSVNPVQNKVIAEALRDVKVALDDKASYQFGDESTDEKTIIFSETAGGGYAIGAIGQTLTEQVVYKLENNEEKRYLCTLIGDAEIGTPLYEVSESEQGSILTRVGECTDCSVSMNGRTWIFTLDDGTIITAIGLNYVGIETTLSICSTSKVNIFQPTDQLNEQSSDKEYPSARAVYSFVAESVNENSFGVVDDALSETSVNPVQNKVIAEALQGIRAEQDSYINCHRTTIEIQTPAWENQPTIQPVTVPFMIIQATYAYGSAGPATLYVENRMELSQVQAGDKLLWWGDASNDQTVEGIRNNVFDTIETVSVGGSNLQITTTGGTALTSSSITYADIKSDGSETLLSDFKLWTDACYFVTLKDTDGTALESGKFKLCTAPDGYAEALNQVFCLPDLATGTETLTENSAVDFLEISDDRQTFTMRTAGQRKITFTAKNPLMRKYSINYTGHCVEENGKKSRILRLHDSAMGKLRRTGKTYGFSEYSSADGCLFFITTASSSLSSKEKNGKCTMGFEIDYARAKNGANISLSMSLNLANKPRDNAIFLTNDNSVDLTVEEINEIRFSDMGVTVANGSVITLEEIG